MTVKQCGWWLIIVAASLALAPVIAEGQEFSPGRKLVVGTKPVAPFVIKTEDGTWSGVSIELWQDVARELGLAYELREYDLQGLIAAVEAGAVDAAVAALTVTAERETRFDFSHPFYSTGLGIAVSADKGGWFGALAGLFSRQFLGVVAALGLLLLGVGLLEWFLERKRNPEQFGGSAAEGIGAGFWWSAVTMTTVGYGDKAPVTLGGRLVALVWMFAGIIVISSFTAAITSSLTVTRLESKVQGPADLPRVRVASVPVSSSEEYLRKHRIDYRTAPNPEAALAVLAAGEVDAVVYDAPVLRYLVHEEFAGRLRVLPQTFERQDYGIAFPADSPLRESVNRVLLSEIAAPEWKDLLYRYLGR